MKNLLLILGTLGLCLIWYVVGYNVGKKEGEESYKPKSITITSGAKNSEWIEAKPIYSATYQKQVSMDGINWVNDESDYFMRQGISWRNEYPFKRTIINRSDYGIEKIDTFILAK